MTNKVKLCCCISGVFLAIGCSSPPTVVLQTPTLINPVCIGPTAHLKSAGAPVHGRETGAFTDTSEHVRKRLTIYLPNPNGNSDGVAVYDRNLKSNFLEESVLEKTAGKHDLSIRNLNFQIRCKDFFLFMPALLVNAFWEYSNERAFSAGRIVETPLNRARSAAAIESAPTKEMPEPATDPAQEGNDANN